MGLIRNIRNSYRQKSIIDKVKQVLPLNAYDVFSTTTNSNDAVSISQDTLKKSEKLLKNCTIEFNSLHWDNVDNRMLSAHKEVMDLFCIPMNYHNINVNHGLWMDCVIRSSKSDLIVFFEPDCIPLNRTALLEYIVYAKFYDTFIGIAQVANHIPPCTHIYAGPGFYVITKSVFKKLGSPSFSRTRKSDVAEEVCYIAEKKGIRHRSLIPTHFEKEPENGIWPVSSLGYYGIGTVYNNSIYHLYESRRALNVDLFVNRCREIISDRFNFDTFFTAATFNYTGKIHQSAG